MGTLTMMAMMMRTDEARSGAVRGGEGGGGG